MKLKIAAGQIPVTDDINANLAAITKALDFAAGEGADILLTPEGSLSGYTHEFDRSAVRRALEEVTARAAAAGVGLALGTCFVEEDGKCYNQIRFYASDGEYLGFHSKTLTCGTMAEPSEGEVNHYAVAPLRTFAFKGVTIGGLICNDMWANPMCTPMPDTHLSENLARMGARIIFHAVNGGRGDDEWRDVAWNFHESNLRMRAKSGKAWVVTVDSCHPVELRCSAPSGLIDPNGNWACRAEPQGERYFACYMELSDSRIAR